MSHIDSNRRKPTGTAIAMSAALLLLLASLGLVACGGSSSTTSTAANASATTPRGGGATGPGGSRFKAIRECLQKNGVKLPQRPPGQRRGGPSGPGGLLGGGDAGGPQPPNGVTRAQLQAALKKCGAGGQFRRGAGRLKNPAYQAALTKFAACMRENGVNVPAPNTSGNGPIFDTKGLNTASAQFKTAEAKCRADLTGALRHGSGTGGAGAGAAGPPPPSGPATG